LESIPLPGIQKNVLAVLAGDEEGKTIARAHNASPAPLYTRLAPRHVAYGHRPGKEQVEVKSYRSVEANTPKTPGVAGRSGKKKNTEVILYVGKER